MNGKSPLTAGLILMLVSTAIAVQSTAGAGDPDPSIPAAVMMPESYSGIDDPMMIRTHWGNIDIDYLDDIIPSWEEDTRSDYWIVQFDGPITRDRRMSIERTGAAVIGYIPDYAYVIDASRAETGMILDIDGVYGLSPYISGLKVTPEVYSILNSEDAGDLYGSHSLMINMFRIDPALISEISGHAEIISVSEPDRIVVSLPLISFESLLRVSGIRFIEPVLDFEIHNDVASDIIGVDLIRERYGLDGTGQTVGIADTGLDTGVDDHEVDGDILADVDNRVAFANWAGTYPDDAHSHGTHVSGSVAGNGSLSNGDIKGMAPNASIFFQGIANDANQLTGIPSNLSLLFLQAYENGSRIHTNSWGSSDYTRQVLGSYISTSRDVDWFTYHYPDMTILFSAGNSGVDWFPSDGKIDEDSIGPPGTSKNAITVGASENYRTTGGSQNNWSGKQSWYYNGSWHVLYNYPEEPVKSDLPSNDPQGLAFFSSRGPTNDGRLKPDVVAPGTNILSLWSTKTTATGWGTSSYSNYIYMGGTSMSCPITAGTAALVREYYNGTLGLDAPSGALIKATLINGAWDMTPGQFGSDNPTTQEINRRPDNDQGWGRIDLGNSLYPDNGSVKFIDHHSGLETDDEINRSFQVLPGNELRLSLVWSDYPAELTSSKQLVNDLDLVLYSPDGGIYHGNDLTYPYDSSRDDKNPVEGITIPDPAPGIWKVSVNAYNVPMAPQHFALVISGNISDLTDSSLFLDSPYYSTDGDLIGMQLFDEDLLEESDVIVNVTSDSFQIGRNVTLVNGGYPGHFLGNITTSNISTTNKSRIYTSHNDNISVKYDDASPVRTITANATAKVPQRIEIIHYPEYSLIYSSGEIMKIGGIGEKGMNAFFTFPGTGIDWLPLRDDGDPASGDEIPDDGNYSALWSVPSDLYLTSNMTALVRDPYLGDLEYPGYQIEFNASVPRWPKNVSVETIPDGNTLRISWAESNETDISAYRIYVNSTESYIFKDIPGWEILTSIPTPADNITLDVFVDGTEYHLRLSAVDFMGNESSLSLPVNGTSFDTVAPEIQIITGPRTLVGSVWFNFTGSSDLELAELEWYDDLNGNGNPDDGGEWINMGFGPAHYFVMDTREGAGGPGDSDHLLLRYRGLDEVPNISPWITVEGFKVDNTGPSSVVITTDLPRITNIDSYEVEGVSEPDGYVLVYLNGVVIENATCSSGGGLFNFSLNLSEGLNHLNLSAYDSVGAGPTNVTRNITLDTMEPAIGFDTEDQSVIQREINWEGIWINSTSADRGLDPEFTIIDNWTWKLDLPGGSVQFLYESGSFHLVFSEVGLYNLTLTVSDLAGNSNTSTISIMVNDTTAPTVNISGPDEVDERVTAVFTTDGTYDNDPGWRVRPGTSYRWFFEGYGGWNISAGDQNVYIRFPGPGFYDVTLWVTDGSGNTGMGSIVIEVLDTTAPDGTIDGPRIVILGDPATFTANVSDNDPTFPAGITFQWNLSYRDGPPENHWSVESEGMTFKYNFTVAGTYYLKLTVHDSAGNERTIELPLDARGDITPPYIVQISPEPNMSFRYRENEKFYVVFNEIMDEDSITLSSIYLSENGTKLEGLSLDILEFRFTDGSAGSRVNINHGGLNFSRTYTLHVDRSIMDEWGNRLVAGISQDFTIRTRFTLDLPNGVFPSSRSDNFSSNDSISLGFTSPPDIESLGSNIRLYQVTDGGRSLEDITLAIGDDDHTVIVSGSFRPGLEYQVIIDQTAVDIYGYELDQEYSWLFRTYMAPVISDDDDDGGDDPADGGSYWYLCSLGVILVILMIVAIIIIALVIRSRHKSRMKKLWKEGEETPRSDEEEEEIEVVAKGKTAMSKLEEELMEGPKKAPEPPSYEDLYGSPQVTEAAVQEEETAPRYTPEVPLDIPSPVEPETFVEPPVPPVPAGKDDDIEWDEEQAREEAESWGSESDKWDDEEDSEGWGEEEEEESWGSESDEWDDEEEEERWGEDNDGWD
ncbi:MAG: S8 family serine peptidase [Thermoplasmatota archaeon]